jgi:hypothetical protein
MIPLAVAAWGTALTTMACWGSTPATMGLSSACMTMASDVQVCELRAEMVASADAVRVFGWCLEDGR